MPESEGFSVKERKILKAMFDSMRPLSTKEIADKSGHAWETCTKILNELAKNNYIIKRVYIKKDKRKFIYWRFNYELKLELKNRMLGK